MNYKNQIKIHQEMIARFTSLIEAESKAIQQLTVVAAHNCNHEYVSILAYAHEGGTCAYCGLNELYVENIKRQTSIQKSYEEQYIY